MPGQESIALCTDSILNFTLSADGLPILSQCFQDVALLVPLVFMSCASLVYFWRYHNSQPHPVARIPFGANSVVHLTLAVSSFLALLLALCARITNDLTSATVGISLLTCISLSLSLFTLVFFMLIFEAERRSGQTRSQILFCYIWLFFFSGLPRLYSLGTQFNQVTTNSLGKQVELSAMISFEIVTFTHSLLMCFGFHSGKASLVVDQKSCPELWVSVPSLWSFHWLTTIIWKAFRGRILAPEDVFSVRPIDSVAPNFKLFQSTWDQSRTQIGVKSNKIRSHVSHRDYSHDAREPLLPVTSVQPSGPFPNSVYPTDEAYSAPLGVTFQPASPSETSNKERRIKSDLTTHNRSVATFALIRALLRAFGCRLLFAWFFLLLGTLVTYASPILLGALLRFLSKPDAPPCEGYAIAVGLILTGLFTALLNERGFYRCTNVGLAARSALSSAIYRKVLNLSSEARTRYTSGALINFLSVDVDRVMQFFMFSFYLWVAVLQFILSFVLLWRQLGWATLAGIGCLGFMIPFNTLIMRITSAFEASEMQWKDNRLKCLGEMFASIKIIKLYAWEKAFLNKVDQIRKGELRHLAHSQLGWGIDSVMWIMAPFLILLATFLAYTWNVAFEPRLPAAVNTTSWVSLHLLDAERIFVSLSLFNMLRTPLQLLPWSLSLVIMAYVSVKRIASFLLSAELDKDAVSRSHTGMSTTAISFMDASFSWTCNGPNILQNVDLVIPQGQFVAIVGAVGSGKSSFLSACLGEMIRREGQVQVNGSIAYVPQTPWIQQKSLRANICFGDASVDESAEKHMWYDTVLSACALGPDIARLVDGDKTEIGERGVNLSGGQRQRVSLARAVYQFADIYLLDDPLSAVDAHVREHLLHQVLGPAGLLKDKTRLLVTNTFQCLNQVDRIVVLSNDGRIIQTGTYDEVCLDKDGHFSSHLRPLEDRPVHVRKGKLRHASAGTDVDSFTMKDRTLLEPPKLRDRSDLFAPRGTSSSLQTLSSTHLGLGVLHGISRIQLEDLHSTPGQHQVNRGISGSTEHPAIPEAVSSPEDSEAESDGSELRSTRFVDEELAASGKIPSSTFLMYLRARGWMLTALTVVAYILCLGVQTFANFWLRCLADDSELLDAIKAFHNATTAHNATARLVAFSRIAERTYVYISGYAWAGLGLIVLSTLSAGSNLASALRASRRLHYTLLSFILRAPTAFFDRTPVGRILNRFSTDIHHLDHDIPTALFDMMACFGESFLALLLVIATLRPAGIGLAIVLSLVLIFSVISLLYMPCSRQARRLDAQTKSGLLSMFGETAASSLGASVVRAFDRIEPCVTAADGLIDRNAAQTYLCYSSNRWLGICLNVLTRCLLFVTVLVVISGREQMTAGLAGLIITYTMDTADDFTWFVKQLVQLETSAISLERIREYTQLPQEASWEHGPDSPPPPEWPSPCCQIIFNKATVSYLSVGANRSSTNGPCALRSVDLVLSGSPSCRRIGIVGRTGAGKSSLASCLFRLVEAHIAPEDQETLMGPYTGPIIVDGVDVARIGLHELRSRFSILPQEPVLFSGTLRFNLDPFGTRPDEELWTALEVAHLKDWMTSGGITLDYECGEDGCNLSAGQRQLVCLARVFLSSAGRVRLLILDEATAAMDPATDQLVMQTAIGDQFKDATVLIIAHRLSTVMGTDMIVVMDHGRVVETGPPSVLLSDPNSRFSQMNRI